MNSKLEAQKVFKEKYYLIVNMQRREFLHHLDVLFALIQGKAVKALIQNGRFISLSPEARSAFLRIYKDEWTRARNDVLAWMKQSGIKALDTAYSIATRHVYALANSLINKTSISPRDVNEATTALSISIAKEIGCPGYSNRFMAFLEAYFIDKCKKALRHPSDGQQYSVREFALFQERMMVVLDLDKPYIIGELLKERENLLTTDGIRDYKEIKAIFKKIIMPHLIRSLKKAKSNFGAVIEATIRFYISQIQTGKINVDLDAEESAEEKRRKKEAAQIAGVNEMIYGVKPRDNSWLLKKDLYEDPLARRKVG